MWWLQTKWACLLTFCLMLQGCLGLPVNKNRAQVKEKHDDPVAGLDIDEYMRYWQEVAGNDPELLERLKKVKDLDLNKLREMIARNPHLQERLVQSRGDIRNQVEEAKRMTVEQMRQLQKLQSMRDNKLLKDGDWMTKKGALRENLPAHFSDKDIRAKLQEAQHNLEALDRKRKEDFKQQEMWMEHRRRQKLAEMSEQQRLKAEDEFRKKQEQLRKHDKLPKPASKDQLEQVWEEDDGMAKEQFDPKTFFHMHDTNADLTLDAIELEALFYNELKKVYKDDMAGLEANEDMARMREYAMGEIDKNGDGLISLNEFMGYAGEKKFDTKDEWHPVVDEDPPFSDKDFKEYEDDYEEDYDYQYDDEGNIIAIVPKKHPSDAQAVPVNQQHHQGQGDQPHPPPQDLGKPKGDAAANALPPGGRVPHVPPVSQQEQPPHHQQGVPAGVQVDDPKSVNVGPVDGKNYVRMAPIPDTQQKEVVQSPGQQQQQQQPN